MKQSNALSCKLYDSAFCSFYTKKIVKLFSNYIIARYYMKTLLVYAENAVLFRKILTDRSYMHTWFKMHKNDLGSLLIHFPKRHD